MRSQTFTFTGSDEATIHVYKWQPAEGVPVKAAVQLAHGMAETAGRYEKMASGLVEGGYAVYANDHKGHGLTAPSIDELGYIGHAGFQGMLQDMKQLMDIIKLEHAGLPVFLLGHSMGSFLVQGYMQHYGEELQGAILSGTNGDPGPTLIAGISLARSISWLYGERHQSKLLNALVFGSYNKDFKPMRSPFDWLSRDEHEVDKYIVNPYCGTLFTASFFRDFFLFLRSLYLPAALAKIPKELPVYMFSGDMDPVGLKTKGVIKLIRAYKEQQLQDVSHRFYPNGRHEMHNEINRDEVMADLLAWLDSK